MTDLRQAAMQALEALRSSTDYRSGSAIQIEAVENLCEAMEQPAQEPFGYFRAEPFGWTDCAETDDGGIALYERPHAAQPEHGDIRALKYRIHELEGEVIGYKRMLEEAALKKLADLGQEIEQGPVAQQYAKLAQHCTMLEAKLAQLEQRKPLTIQPVVKDKSGVLRFKANAIVQHLLDTHPTVDMNRLATMEFTDNDQQQFAQLIGYSVSDYGSLSYVTDDAYDAAEQAAHGIKEGT